MKLNIILVFSIVLVFLTGCKDEKFLDEKPHAPSDYDFYRTPDGALQGINSAYHILRRGEDVERVEFMGTICSGDAMAGGEPGGNDQTFMQNNMKFTTDPDNDYCFKLWINMYRGVYRCNLLLSYMAEPIPDFPDALRIRLQGEALFLRGLFHFKLQSYYGGYPQLQSDFNNKLLGVPFNDHVLLVEEWKPERPPLEETWTKIEDDFKAAAELLPEKDAYKDSDLGRATKGASLAMLAKTYLYQEKFTEAYDAAKLVINSGQYWLEGDDEHPGPYIVQRSSKEGVVEVEMAPYKWIFQPEANNSGGSIFSNQHYMESVTAPVSDNQLGNLLPQYYGPRRIMQLSPNGDGTTTATSTDYFWGFILPTKYFVETAYENIGCEVADEIVDPRYRLSVVEPTDSFPYDYGDAALVEALPDSVAFDPYGNWPSTGYCTWKYFTDPIFTSVQSGLNDHPQNTKYLRFADLLLIGAEAAVMSNQTADALTWINKVRERARNSGNTGYPLPLTEVTRDDVLAERRVELAFEGHQFFDIVRTGRAQEIIVEEAFQEQYRFTVVEGRDPARQQFGDNFTVGKNEIWPIPDREIDATEGSIVQNPNY